MVAHLEGGMIMASGVQVSFAHITVCTSDMIQKERAWKEGAGVGVFTNGWLAMVEFTIPWISFRN